MKLLPQSKLAVVGSLALLVALAGLAFPPAPHHQFYGMVRDEFGTPLSLSGAEVVFVTAEGTQLRAATVAPDQEPGVNYQMSVPLDSGVTAAVYKPTAVLPNQMFRLQVRMGQVMYLPIEMMGEFSHIGQPARRTRLDLTLGEDTDGDGLPDAWERALIALLGGNLTLADIRPDGDADGDGMSNRNEYLAGTFAFDPADGFSLGIAGFNGGTPVLEFLALSGRTYMLQGSSDLRNWNPVQFRIVSGGASVTLQDRYLSTDVRLLQAEVPQATGAVTNRYFRALVQ